MHILDERMRRKEIIVIGLLFLFFIFLVSYQHATLSSWDFSVYVLNAKYWLGQSQYFEPMRPPLMPLILIPLSVFGWKMAEYLFLFLVSGLYFYSTIRFADAMRWSRVYFLMLGCNAFIVFYGLYGGSELLAFALVELFVAGLISGKVSGHYLGLACLTRYFNAAYLPLLLFTRRLKTFILNILFFVLVFIGWFYYNHKTYGNIFYSIADGYALNAFFHERVFDLGEVVRAAVASNVLLPLVCLGLVFGFFTLFRRKGKPSQKDEIMLDDKNKGKNPSKAVSEKTAKEGIRLDRTTSRALSEKRTLLLMLAFLMLSLYGLVTIPVNEWRYFFPVFLPFLFFAYYGAFAVSGLAGKRSKIFFKVVMICLFIVNLLLIAGFLSLSEAQDEELFLDAVQIIQEKDIGSCRIASNAWPHLNYYGITSEIWPWQELVWKELYRGKILVIFKRYGGMYEEWFVKRLPVMYEDDEMYIFRYEESCLPVVPVHTSYISWRNAANIELFNKSLEIEPCRILFSSELMQKACGVSNSVFKILRR